MKFTFENKLVTIRMTVKQMESLEAIFDSLTYQIDKSNRAYGDCVVAIESWERAQAKAMALLPAPTGNYDGDAAGPIAYKDKT